MNGRYKISLSQAKELQKWALRESKADSLLNGFSEYRETEVLNNGIYVDYTIDEEEFDGGADYPDIGVVAIVGVVNQKAYFLGELRAYNHETYWLSTNEIEEYDDTKKWISDIKKDFEALKKEKKNIPKITSLLKKDSDIIKEHLKSILDHEDEYAPALYAIEETVTNHYLKNKRIKDKELIQYLKHFLKNIDKAIEEIESEFERDLYNNLVEALEIKKITKHELKLCIKYILWSIDNRSWLNDPQAYVKWLAHSSGVMDKDESKAYEKKIKIFCKRKGVPNEQVEAMLKNDFSDIKVADKPNTDIESEFFALDDDKKLDFVIEHFQDSPFLGELYYYLLMEEGDFDGAELLCKKILEMMPEFPPIEILLGIVYKEKDNRMLAKHHFENALNIIEKIPDDVIPEKDVLIKQANDLIKEVS